ncbi:MAG: hypothetical protein IPK88_00270 [Saprospiraceae bacterium]|nr:hypothetical protein [Candidatus Defluviibacterium haderslevense]
MNKFMIDILLQGIDNETRMKLYQRARNNKGIGRQWDTFGFIHKAKPQEFTWYYWPMTKRTWTKTFNATLLSI